MLLFWPICRALLLRVFLSCSVLSVSGPACSVALPRPPVDPLSKRASYGTLASLVLQGIHSVASLLWHLPTGVVDRRQVSRVQGLVEGEVATVLLKVCGVELPCYCQGRSMLICAVGSSSTTMQFLPSLYRRVEPLYSGTTRLRGKRPTSACINAFVLLTRKWLAALGRTHEAIPLLTCRVFCFAALHRLTRSWQKALPSVQRIPLIFAVPACSPR